MFVHFLSVYHLYSLENSKSLALAESADLRECVCNGKALRNSNNTTTTTMSEEEKENLALMLKLPDLIDLIVNYANQYRKRTENNVTRDPKQTTAHILKENAQMEAKMRSELMQIYERAAAKSSSSSSIYQAFLLCNLLEMQANTLASYLNNSTIYSKYIQESFIDCFTTLCQCYADCVRLVHRLHDEPDKLSRVALKSLVNFIVWEKILEHMFKFNHQTMTQHSEKSVQTCVHMIQQHESFLKWFDGKNLLNKEELEKYFSSFENQVIRFSAIFYSEESIENYIRLQNVSLGVCFSRLRFVLKVVDNKREQQQQQLDHHQLMRTFHSVCDNLFLILRLKDRFDEAFDVVRHVYAFIREHELERQELEWLVTNWCKIKRDLWKSQKRTHEKVSIVDYLDISPGNTFLYLIEELHTYNSFKAMDNALSMSDEIQHLLH